MACGSGGHNISRLVRPARGEPAQEPEFGSDASHLESNPGIDTGGLLPEKYNDRDYGCLRVGVDAKQLRIGFHVALNGALNQSRFDLVTVDLASHTMVSNRPLPFPPSRPSI